MRRRSLIWWLYQPYKFLVVAPVIAVSTLGFAAVALLLRLFLSSRTASSLTAVPWARLNAWLTPVKVRVEGRGNLDAERSYVLVCNHQSQYDIFVLYGWLGVDFKWVMKEELRKVPGLGAACDRLEHIFIDRSDHRAAMASLEEAKERIVDGTSVIFFPEGTRSRDGRLMRFKKGAFRMALDLQLPILPLTVSGTRDVLPAGTTDLMPGSARLVIHPPIETDGCDADDLARLLTETRHAIASVLPLDE
jgi:1-acyl-sn-glycerol-3-phosphate acyltransferase